jgi:hypothetical protein
MERSDSSSWSVAAALATEAGTMPVVPTRTAHTQRTSDTDRVFYAAKSSDSNAGVSSIAAVGPSSMGPGSYPWRALAFELRAQLDGALFWAFP